MTVHKNKEKEKIIYIDVPLKPAIIQTSRLAPYKHFLKDVKKWFYGI